MLDDSELDNYAEWLRKKGKPATTISTYTSLIRCAYGYGDPIEAILDDERAPKSRRTMIAALKSWCRYDENENLLEELNDIKKPRDVRLAERPPLSREEWADLRDCVMNSERITEAEGAALGIMLERGLRVGDICRLKREEVSEGVRRGVLRFTAKGGERYRYTTKRFGKYLKSLNGLFKSRKGAKTVAELISPSARKDPQRAAIGRLGRALKAIGEECGIDPDEIYTHRARRTYATYFLEAAKGDINKLKKHMQWKSLETAALYVDYINDQEMDAIADSIDDE